MVLLQTDRLTKDYGSFRALDQVSLHVAPGEVVGLLGPNGSGKTTALRIVMGFLKATSGQATIAGHDCWEQSVLARQQVAYLPGELRLYENMTGRQLVEFLCRLREQAPPSKIDALADLFDIDLDRPLAQLSSGMKRKVALLQTLVTEAPLVIMDEPTNALDPTMRDQLLAQVREARQRGQAVLFSSHVLSEVEQVCDRVALLRRGKLVHHQRMDELREGRLVRVAFTKPLLELPDLAGLTTRSHEAGQTVFEFTGNLPELLGWLSTQEVREMHMESLGLKSIYARHHGATE